MVQVPRKQRWWFCRIHRVPTLLSNFPSFPPSSSLFIPCQCNLFLSPLKADSFFLTSLLFFPFKPRTQPLDSTHGHNGHGNVGHRHGGHWHGWHCGHGHGEHGHGGQGPQLTDPPSQLVHYWVRHTKCTWSSFCIFRLIGLDHMMYLMFSWKYCGDRTL